MTTSATLESSTVAVEPGEKVEVPITVTNDSTIVDEYTLEAIGPTVEWTVVQPTTVTLLPGQSATITLTFSPPRSSAVLAGDYDYGVQVLPTEHPDEVTVLEGSIVVNRFFSTTAELIPRISHGRRGARHHVALDNRGNTAITANLVGPDETQLLDFRIPPEIYTVDPGTTTMTRVNVRPHSLIWRGVPLTHAFTVEVEVPDQPAVVLAGSHVQDAVLPPWFLKAALAALALLVALLGIWFLLIKPVVETTAQEAVEESVQKAHDDAREASAAASKAAVGAAGAESSKAAAESASEDAQKIAEDLTGVPRETLVPESERLAVTATAGKTSTTKYAFDDPSVEALSLTDLVMSNPQGDFGRLRLELGEKVILDLALENFRDTDYHFLTPIRVASDETLQLTMTCNKAGAPPAQTTPPKGCSSSALLGGNLVSAPPADADSAPASSEPGPE